MPSPTHKPLLLVIMDGVGVREDTHGNALHHAYTPHMEALKQQGLYTTLLAHGTHVGLASDEDMGGSEVGHNTMGAGAVYPQGAKLVEEALSSGRIFDSKSWKQLSHQIKNHASTLHFLGLLSDGGIHSHIDHLEQLMEKAAQQGMLKQRLHILLDGRDVAPHSAEIYLQRLEQTLSRLQKTYQADILVASGGGRMQLTMDRYQANWGMVQRGWQHHVLGKGSSYGSALEALKELRKKHPTTSDQDLPGFVISHEGHPVGKIQDGDGVVCFNFRADRVIQISQAFTQKDFPYFPREVFPKVLYCGMLLYDGDTELPEHYLVKSPPIPHPFSEILVQKKIRQFACSETQKYGHVTFFWNGNRSGYFDAKYEEYLEIPSHPPSIPFDHKPWMKSYEITQETCRRLYSKSFDFLRINFAAGDMVGHTGNLQAAIVAVSVIDQMLGELMKACQKTQTTLVVTADHGNCEEMYQKGNGLAPKTSHTLNPVPLYIWNHGSSLKWRKDLKLTAGLSHLSSTLAHLMSVPLPPHYQPSLLINGANSQPINRKTTSQG